MNALILILIWITAFVGISCLLSRSLFRTLLGVLFLSHCANLILFLLTGPKPSLSAIITDGKNILAPDSSDPLAQALILTAIVISFGFLAFLLALAREAYEVLQTDELETIQDHDQLEKEKQ